MVNTFIYLILFHNHLKTSLNDPHLLMNTVYLVCLYVRVCLFENLVYNDGNKKFSWQLINPLVEQHIVIYFCANSEYMEIE